jgi:type II secretory pathway pseudopilin PulG
MTKIVVLLLFILATVILAPKFVGTIVKQNRAEIAS